MMRLAQLFISFLLLLHPAEGAGLLHGLLRRVDRKVRPAVRKQLTFREPRFRGHGKRRLTSSPSSSSTGSDTVARQR